MPEIEYLVVDHLSRKDITRIFKRIKVNPITGCWEWQGARMKDTGYGVLRYKGTTESLHRLLYAWAVEKLPKRKRGEPYGDSPELDHVICSNPPCCNPVHVALVPHKRNMLREFNPTAQNARKPHCSRGHLLPTESNESWNANGRRGRRCIPCRRLVRNARYHERMAGPDAEKLRNAKAHASKDLMNGPRREELLQTRRERRRKSG